MKSHITPYIYILFFSLIFSTVQSQELHLKISTKDSLQHLVFKSLEFQRLHQGQASLLTTLDSVKKKLELRGFLNSELDSLIQKDSVVMAFYNLGPVHAKLKVFYSQQDIDKNDLKVFIPTIQENYFEIATQAVPETLNAIAGIFESKGQAFVEVSLSQILLKDNHLEAHLKIKGSTLRTIDKIVIEGYDDFPKSFVKNTLRLNLGSTFNTNKLSRASRMINALAFVSEIKTPEVLFTPDSTLVYLFLEKKASNKFDGLIGFSSAQNGKGLSFNGYLDLALNNIFNGGESLLLNWKSNGGGRQHFNVSTLIPYILESNFSAKASLSIFKQDSTFVNTKGQIDLIYLLSARQTLGVSLQNETSSDLLENNLNTGIKNFKNLLYGLNYNYQIIREDQLFPIKFNLFAEALTGHRKITDTKTAQTKLFFKASYLWSLNLKNHLFLKNESGNLFSENTITNELYRLGGVNSIRGFNEEQLFASTFSYFNIEYRYKTNNTSYLYTITDLGYVNNDLSLQTSRIYALGLGYSFNTKVGFINLSYAIGGFSGQALNFDNSRFHLKFISFF